MAESIGKFWHRSETLVLCKGEVTQTLHYLVHLDVEDSLSIALDTLAIAIFLCFERRVDLASVGQLILLAHLVCTGDAALFKDCGILLWCEF